MSLMTPILLTDCIYKKTEHIMKNLNLYTFPIILQTQTPVPNPIGGQKELCLVFGPKKNKNVFFFQFWKSHLSMISDLIKHKFVS